jgi:hypothetical protein
MFRKILSVSFFLVVIASCTSKKGESEGDWIKGTEGEKIKMIEKHFRGFDNAMVETGYRYQELYWAGRDTNWEYAKYQLEKIKIAMEYGLQRRPLRAKSAGDFLTNVLPAVKQSVESRDTAKFNKEFLVLTASCNSCHAMENLQFFNVRPPIERQSSIRK